MYLFYYLEYFNTILEYNYKNSKDSLITVVKHYTCPQSLIPIPQLTDTQKIYKSEEVVSLTKQDFKNIKEPRDL